jgi:hypothetical protein
VIILLCPAMPNLAASHGNTAGGVNGTMPEFLGLLLILIRMYGFSAILLVLPRTDPLREN